MLGAVVPVHRKGPNGIDCGVIQLEDGVQTLEAMLWTVQRVNEEKDLLPGIKLGLIAYDSCDNPTHALEQSVDFVKGFISHLNVYHNDSDILCSDGQPAVFRGGADQVVAVIGGLSSSVTIQLAMLMNMFKVPQVSYMSTSPALSDRTTYPYFFRTVPSDMHQAHAMLELLRKLGWTYVSVAYSDTEYGRHGWELLSALAVNYSVCFASPVHRIDKQDFTDEEATNTVLTLNATETKIVIVFSESFQPSVVKFLLKARDLDVLERFTWVFSDLWTNKFSERADKSWQAKLLEGSMCVHPISRPLDGFNDYFMGLRLDHERVNPWWRELWWSHFKCRDEEHSKGMCADPHSTVQTVNGPSEIPQARYLHFVRDAIWAVAQALTDMQRERCGGRPGRCEAMRHIQGTVLKDYLRKVQFNDVNNRSFTFQNGRDGPPRYSVLNYQRSDTAAGPGPHLGYSWVSVGDYTLNDDGSGPSLHVDAARIRSRGDAPLPTSTCTPDCAVGHIKIRARDACCWHCRRCGEFQRPLNEWACEDCPAGQRPTDDHLACEQVPEECIGYTHPWAVCAMAVASLGLVCTAMVSAVFWTHRHTPVIKAAGRELSALLLVAELASFLVTFVMVAPPTAATCGLTRFALGFCFTLSYATVLTKTNRIARIFNQCPGAGPKKTRYTSPGSQLVITALLTSVEALINLAWLAYEPASVHDYYPSRAVRQRVCVGLDDTSYLVGLAYPLVLIGLCVVYAVKTRKCPGGFNETRHIAFTTYTVTIIWLAFVPLYLASTSTAIRTVTLAMSLSLSGLVQLACLFFPKVYIVMLKPEKNTKEVVMMSTCHRTLGSTGTLPAHHLHNPAAALVRARQEGRSPCPSEMGSDMSPAMATSLADHDEDS
ncbi:hypothetical protein ONE63_002069 [Megalurothrips usitatus]|uniref:G-protein coupled receptors family 3 profile domain-containing protein n=1 Tax=Megalurothrips usitatus TaxID=439358 RepID=A0AAV7XEY7_9NEOP|nr:hypothetical protein ONE63_002069 [Megalurothrips usitatus]